MFEIDEKRFPQEFVREFQDGELIFTEGEESREMYVIQSGEVVILKKKHGNDETQLAHLRRGEFLGEMALLESLPRTASARAVGHTRLLVLQPGGFLLKIRRDPTFAFEMLQQLSRRIRVTNERLVGALSQGSREGELVRSILSNTEFTTGDKSS